MKSRKLTVIGSVLSLIFPLWKATVPKVTQSEPKPTSEKAEFQFGEQDRAGVFQRTHENCIPTKQDSIQIELKDDSIRVHSGVACGLLAKIEWSGMEGWTTWLNRKLLADNGLVGCEAIYCRPVNVPGGSSLWLSYLPNRDSRNPLRDELYSRKADA